MRTGTVGDISELIFLTALMAADKETAIPYGNRPGYDLLVRGDSGWLLIQIKTAYRRSMRNGNIYCDFLRGSGKSSRRAYTKSDIDFLVGVLPETREYWVFPINFVEGKRCTTVTRQSEFFMAIESL